MLRGILYGVSVGPGDPELMTLKAVRIIEKCAVIAAPITHSENSAALSIVEKICNLSGKIVRKPRFTMSRDRDVLAESHLRIAGELSEYLDGGSDVAFITIGDISVYSTFWYIARILMERGYEAEICAGVTSFCAAAAVVKKPLVLGSEPLMVLPASCAELEELCDVRGTKVIMKSGRSVSNIRGKLNGKSVYAVENCGYENQRIFGSLDEIDDDSGYFTTIIAK